MPNPEDDEMTTAPCGCRFWTTMTPSGRAFVMEPCSLDCPTYKYARSEMDRQGKPAEIIDLR